MGQSPICLWTGSQICIFKNIHNTSNTCRSTSIRHLLVCMWLCCFMSLFFFCFFLHSQQINNVLTASSHSHLCSTVSHGKHVSCLCSVVFLPLVEASVSCHVSVLPVSAVKPPDTVMNPEEDDSYLTDLTYTHTHTYIRDVSAVSVSHWYILGVLLWACQGLPCAANCFGRPIFHWNKNPVDSTIWLFLKYTPVSLARQIFLCILQRPSENKALSHLARHRVLMWSRLKENWGIFGLIFSTCLFALLACQLTHQVRKRTTCVFLDGVTAQKRLVWILCDFLHHKSTSLL